MHSLSIDFFFVGVLVGEGVGWVYFCYIILFVEGIANVLSFDFMEFKVRHSICTEFFIWLTYLWEFFQTAHDN